MPTVRLTINGRTVEAAPGASVLEAARANDVHIPSLCFMEGLTPAGACRLCVVEVEGAKTLQASCVTEVREGMVVKTDTPRVRRARRMLLELLLSDHPRDCLRCARNQHCELQSLAEAILPGEDRFEAPPPARPVDDSSAWLVRDAAKCVLCRRCVAVCDDVQEVGAIAVQNRGSRSIVAAAGELPLADVACAACGQCTLVCPVGALAEKDALEAVWDALADPRKRVVAQTAPAIRAALGEEFGFPPGTCVTGKMAAALRALGFDDVFDTNFAADLTIIEEGHEFLARAKAALVDGDGHLPLLTSCSPGWIKYLEHEFPGLTAHLSTCKSPHMMLGAVAKAYYAEKVGARPEDMFVVSVMPCTAKKFEAARPEMFWLGRPTVDAVLTTRELARMIRAAGVDFAALPDAGFDDPLGESTGAADIFAATGGVMEAALRTVYELVTGREIPFPHLDVAPVRGLARVKEATIRFENVKPEFSFLEGFEARVAVTSGLSGAKALMRDVARGTSPYHFVEVMACPGGCISGGGQPRPTTQAVREARMRAIYAEDAGKPRRKSHENPSIARLYADFLGTPNGRRAHELLHTHYVPRGRHGELLPH